MILRHLKNVALLLRTQRSSRHKNCRIGGLMFLITNMLEIQLQKVFYLGFSNKILHVWSMRTNLGAKMNGLSCCSNDLGQLLLCLHGL